MNKLDQYISQSKTKDYQVATRRVAASLQDHPYSRVPINTDIGKFASHYDNSTYNENAQTNAKVRGIAGRVYKEAQRLKPGIMDALGVDQFSTLVSMGVDRLLNNIIPEKEQGNDAEYGEAHNLRTSVDQWSINQFTWQDPYPQMYSESARNLVDFLNDEVGDEVPDSIAMLPVPGDGSGGPEGEMLLAAEDYLKYLSRSGADFEAMSRGIDDMPALSMTTDATLKKSRWGDIVVPTTMRDLSQVDKIFPAQLATLGFAPEYFGVQLTSNELMVAEKYEQQDKVRLEVVVVDSSGSMFSQGRAVRALAYVTNRLNKVIEGRAQIGLIFFNDYPFPMVLGYNYDTKKTRNAMVSVAHDVMASHPEKWVIDTPEKAKDAKDQFLRVYRKLAGGTNIPKAVNAAYLMADTFQKHVGETILDGPPHITIITDSDSGSYGIDVRKKYVINALITDNNPGIQRACVETGGFFGTLNAIRNPGR